MQLQDLLANQMKGIQHEPKDSPILSELLRSLDAYIKNREPNTIPARNSLVGALNSKYPIIPKRWLTYRRCNSITPNQKIHTRIMQHGALRVDQGTPHFEWTPNNQNDYPHQTRYRDPSQRSQSRRKRGDGQTKRIHERTNSKTSSIQTETDPRRQKIVVDT